MTIAEEMAADPRYANYFRVVGKMLAEAARQRLAGEIMPARRVSEGYNDWQNKKLGLDWA